jgi:hypothetical protein
MCDKDTVALDENMNVMDCSLSLLIHQRRMNLCEIPRNPPNARLPFPHENRIPKPQDQRRFIVPTRPVQLHTGDKPPKKITHRSKHLPVTPSANSKVVQLMSISTAAVVAMESRG